MSTVSDIKDKIETYQNDIVSFTAELDADKEYLEILKEQKRNARGGKTGRISSSDYSLQLAIAKYDLEIAQYETSIALYRNQIKLRKEAVAELKKELKALKK